MSSGDLYLEGLIHGGAYFPNFTVIIYWMPSCDFECAAQVSYYPEMYNVHNSTIPVMSCM